MLARRPPKPEPSPRAAGRRRIAPQRYAHEPLRWSLTTQRDARAQRCPCQPHDAQASPSNATASSRRTLDTLRAVPLSSRRAPCRSRCVAPTDGHRRCPVLASGSTRASLAGQRLPGAVAVCQNALVHCKRLAAAAPCRGPRSAMVIAERTTSHQDPQRLQRSTRMRADASIIMVEEIPTRML